MGINYSDDNIACLPLKKNFKPTFRKKKKKKGDKSGKIKFLFGIVVGRFKNQIVKCPMCVTVDRHYDEICQQSKGKLDAIKLLGQLWGKNRSQKMRGKVVPWMTV